MTETTAYLFRSAGVTIRFQRKGDGVELVLQHYILFDRSEPTKSQLKLAELGAEYTKKYLTKVRLGQGVLQ